MSEKTSLLELLELPLVAVNVLALLPPPELCRLAKTCRQLRLFIRSSRDRFRKFSCVFKFFDWRSNAAISHVSLLGQRRGDDTVDVTVKSEEMVCNGDCPRRLPHKFRAVRKVTIKMNGNRFSWSFDTASRLAAVRPREVLLTLLHDLSASNIHSYALHCASPSVITLRVLNSWLNNERVSLKKFHMSSLSGRRVTHRSKIEACTRRLLKTTSLSNTFIWEMHWPLSEDFVTENLLSVRRCFISIGKVEMDDEDFTRWNPEKFACLGVVEGVSHRGLLAWIDNPRRREAHSLHLRLPTREVRLLITALGMRSLSQCRGDGVIVYQMPAARTVVLRVPSIDFTFSPWFCFVLSITHPSLHIS